MNDCTTAPDKMFMGYADAAALLLLVILVAHYVHTHWILESPRRLPPGPKSLPVLGNIHQLPKDELWKTLGAWSAQYGDVVFARFFRTRVLVINSITAAQKLLEKRSSVYSDRPRFTLHVELMGIDSMVSHMRYGERFRKHRRWIHAGLQDQAAVTKFRPVRVREACKLVSDLIDAPDRFVEHIERYVGALIIEVAYGNCAEFADGEYVQLARRATCQLSEAGSPVALLVDFFPALKYLPAWMPGAGFQKQAAMVRRSMRLMLDVSYATVRKAMAAGTAPPSMTTALLDEICSKGELTEEEEEDIKGTVGVLFGAATETTVSTMSLFFLVMVLHPEVYKKAQEEIDRVIGPGRLPDFGDRENLPYLECVLNELYRWNVPLPLCIPHQLMKDDEYNGYHIPGDTMVVPNIWAMSQDESFYPQPDKFSPERFYEMDTATLAAADPRRMVFGFGRRICPGRQFADEALWIAIASITATVDITKARDALGEEITPPRAFLTGFFSRPAPFECAVRPRSSVVTSLVSQMKASFAA